MGEPVLIPNLKRIGSEMYRPKGYVCLSQIGVGGVDPETIPDPGFLESPYFYENERGCLDSESHRQGPLNDRRGFASSHLNECWSHLGEVSLEDLEDESQLAQLEEKDHTD